jgi:hypothetical protein
MPGYYFYLGCDGFHAHPFQFIIHCHPVIGYCIYEILTVSLNKQKMKEESKFGNL